MCTCRLVEVLEGVKRLAVTSGSDEGGDYRQTMLTRRTGLPPIVITFLQPPERDEDETADNTAPSFTPFSGQFRRQCMHFGNSAGNFGGSAVRRPVGHGSAAAMSKLVALLPNYMQIVQNWSEKGVANGSVRLGPQYDATHCEDGGLPRGRHGQSAHSAATPCQNCPATSILTSSSCPIQSRHCPVDVCPVRDNGQATTEVLPLPERR